MTGSHLVIPERSFDLRSLPSVYTGGAVEGNIEFVWWQRGRICRYPAGGPRLGANLLTVGWDLPCVHGSPSIRLPACTQAANLSTLENVSLGKMTYRMFLSVVIDFTLACLNRGYWLEMWYIFPGMLFPSVVICAETQILQHLIDAQTNKQKIKTKKWSWQVDASIQFISIQDNLAEESISCNPSWLKSIFPILPAIPHPKQPQGDRDYLPLWKYPQRILLSSFYFVVSHLPSALLK